MEMNEQRKRAALLPIVLFTGILLGLVLIRVLFDLVLPGWAAWGMGILWGMMAFDYLLRAQLFKQIGGFLVVLILLVILVGALMPKAHVARYPRTASDQLVRFLDSGWNAVTTGQVLTEFSLKQKVLGYAASLGQLDPFRQGKMILFGMLGVALAVCFLFPLRPPQVTRPSREVYARYIGRFLLLLFVGAVFSLQVELLQILAPTRIVSVHGMVDGTLGFFLGLLLFVPAHMGYAVVAEHRAKGSPRFNVLGIGVDAVTMQDCLHRFESVIERGQPSVSPAGNGGPLMTTALGVAGIVEARRNQKLQRILNDSVLNTPDGMPLVWLGKLFGYRNIERVYGPDLLRDVCAYSATRGWRHFFYGAAPGIVDKLKVALEARNPGIEVVGTYCPPFRPLTPEEEAALVAQVAEAKPDIFWIGISTPKQLYFMDAMREKLACKILCPVGYAFDVNAGVEEDAPDWAKYSGFQWLHRAIKQPRLWKRYLPDNPRFVGAMLLQVLRLRKFPLFLHERKTRPFTDAEGYPRFPAGVVTLSAMTLQGARDRVLHWVATGQRHYVNICTADTMVQCFDRPDLARIVEGSGMATTDGMPLVWLARRYGFRTAERVYGPDLMLSLCAATSDHPATSVTPPVSHFFYGATDEVLAQLKENLLRKFPELKIAGMYAPPFRPLDEQEKEDVAARINASGADIVWCGLGTPKQDYWVAEFRPRLKAAALLAVGAAFNFHAGQVRQAPRWMQRIGMEWFFRLCAEPRRLWRRYVIGNPRFVLMELGNLWRRPSE